MGQGDGSSNRTNQGIASDRAVQETHGKQDYWFWCGNPVLEQMIPNGSPAGKCLSRGCYFSWLGRVWRYEMLFIDWDAAGRNPGGWGGFFACDVLHHLSDEEWDSTKQTIIKRCDFIVIKDIDCRLRLKNWMNRMHDRIINGEKIRDIDPADLAEDFQMNGYQCNCWDMCKLWYPHFLLFAVREKEHVWRKQHKEIIILTF